MSLTIMNINNYNYLRGGVERYFFDLNSLLKNHGHSVIHFTSEQPGSLDPFKKPRLLQAPTLSDVMRFIYSPKMALALKKLLRQQKPDMAHLHLYYGQLTSSILAPLEKAGIPIVQTLHDFKIVCPVYTLFSNGQLCQDCRGHAFWHATLKRCNRDSLSRSVLSTVESYVSTALGAVRKINHFIAVSDFVRNKVIELGISAERITTVHNFRDTTGMVPYTQPGSHFLYFGRLERIKGIFTLLQAASSLRNIPLFIVGVGEARPKLEEIIEKDHLQHIKLLGFVPDNELSHLIRHSICTLYPSEWYETFGITLLEAFAHGRPVVASRIGGMTEVVSDGVDGFLVSPGDTEMLRDRLLWMSQHRHEAVEMGLSGRRKVETQFHPESHYEQIMSVYRKVL